MSFWSRMFGKESRTGAALARMFLGQPVWTSVDFATFAREAYQRNMVAFRCVNLIAASAASVPWLLYKPNGDEITQHPLLDLLKRPNPLESGREFFTRVYAFDVLSGNTYIEHISSGRQPKELYALRPDRMRIIPGAGGFPAAFEYRVGGGTIRFQVDYASGQAEVLHVKRFNPLDDWYGQSALQALGYSIDSHNEATKWNMSVLQNGARPSGVLEHKTTDGAAQPLTDEEYRRLKLEIKENWKNSRGEPVLIEGGLHWTQMMLSQMDVDWRNGKELSAREIAVGLGVPEQLVGVPGQQTFNNYREARLSFYEDTVLPLLDRYADSLTWWFSMLYQDDFRLAYDPDQIPALSLRREQVWDRITKTEVLTAQEKREALGYSPEPTDDMGTLFVSAGLVPLRMAVAEDEEGLEPLESGAGAAVTSPEEDVQRTALNGAQIAALQSIAQAVAQAQLPPETAIQVILVSFPSVTEQQARRIIDPADGFKPADVNREIEEENEKVRRKRLALVAYGRKDAA